MTKAWQGYVQVGDPYVPIRLWGAPAGLDSIASKYKIVKKDFIRVPEMDGAWWNEWDKEEPRSVNVPDNHGGYVDGALALIANNVLSYDEGTGEWEYDLKPERHPPPPKGMDSSWPRAWAVLYKGDVYAFVSEHTPAAAVVEAERYSGVLQGKLNAVRCEALDHEIRDPKTLDYDIGESAEGTIHDIGLPHKPWDVQGYRNGYEPLECKVVRKGLLLWNREQNRWELPEVLRKAIGMDAIPPKRSAV